VVFGEQLGEPGVETGEDGFFADVDGGGVLGMLAGIVAMDLASLVGTVVVPGSFHPPTALGAREPTGQHIVAALFRVVRVSAVSGCACIGASCCGTAVGRPPIPHG
jgi:hypothetical protein